MEQLEGLKSQLELKEPQLAMVGIGSLTTRGEGFDPLTEAAHLAGLDAKVQALKSQLERVRAEATLIEQVERSTVQLQRKKELEEKNYRYLSANLEQARIDTALDSGKVSNISVVQSASSAVLNYQEVKKKVTYALVGSILGGLGLAFLIEIFFDQTIKRPSEVSTRLGIPLFLTIQELRKKRQTFLPWANNGRSKSLLGLSKQAPCSPETASWDPNHPLRSYHEALRDRMVMYFEQHKMVHKPKVIGVTSCGSGAGVTTLATGLAAMLSECGDGKVLLVDLTREHGAAHPFFRGRPACGLLDVLEHGENHSAQVLERLDVVSGSGANGSGMPVRSKQFIDLMPRLKASNYDYVIFDLPRLTQTSVTLRLAGFMDKMLVVIKAEETHRNVLRQAFDLLKESGASSAAVLNRQRNYTPSWFHEEF
jgi:Mrp family chromosome partitioning ATPase